MTKSGCEHLNVPMLTLCVLPVFFFSTSFVRNVFHSGKYSRLMPEVLAETHARRLVHCALISDVTKTGMY
jgi:hypothetical protein